MCALDESVVDRRSLLRAGDEPALQHPEQRRFLADLQRRQCLAGRLQPVRSLSRGLNGGVVDKFEKRFVLCRRFVRRFLRRADRDALGNEWRAPERLGLGISVSRDFRATRKSDAVFRRHHDAERRAAIQLRAEAMRGRPSVNVLQKGIGQKLRARLGAIGLAISSAQAWRSPSLSAPTRSLRRTPVPTIGSRPLSRILPSRPPTTLRTSMSGARKSAATTKPLAPAAFSSLPGCRRRSPSRIGQSVPIPRPRRSQSSISTAIRRRSTPARRSRS